MKILVVDDDPTVRLVLTRMLEALGHEVTVAADGEEAWRILRVDHHSAVIADWLMPALDGIGLCKRIRAAALPGGYVYLILLTSKTDRADRKAGLAAGADDFLAKPPDRDSLTERLGVAERILGMADKLREANELLDRRRQHEIEIGGTIQRALLMARAPEANGRFEFAVMNVPSSQIDGDFFDFFVHQQGVVDVFVGDAMGKGVPAALVGAGTKSYMLRALGTLLAEGDRSRLPRPVEIVQKLHDGLSEQLMRLSSFVTLGYARLDAIARTATFVDAGHTKSIHLRHADATTETVDGGHFPIGFTEKEVYGEIVRRFDDGDLFCFYSDGVTEAQSREGELFGIDRLTAILREHHKEPPSGLLYRLREAVREHTGDRPLDDDFTCVMVRVGGGAVGWKDRLRSVPSDLEALGDVRRFVGECAVACGLDGPLIDELQLAAHEAATNVIRHAHGEGSGKSIDLRAERAPQGGIVLSLEYEAPPFRPPVDAIDPVITTHTEGGMGLFIMRSTVDRLEFDHDERTGRSATRLTKWSA